MEPTGDLTTDILTTILNGLGNGSYGAYITAGMVILGALVTIASAIAPLTKTPKDDEVIGKIKGFIQRFSIIKPGK